MTVWKNKSWIKKTLKEHTDKTEFGFVKAAVLGVSLDQGPKALVKAEGKTVYLPCKVSSSNYIHWYQMKDGKAPSRLLYISDGGGVTRDSNNPQANDFTVDKTKLYDLKLSDIKKSHAAVYFCAYWETSSGHSENIYSHPVHELHW